MKKSEKGRLLWKRKYMKPMKEGHGVTVLEGNESQGNAQEILMER